MDGAIAFEAADKAKENEAAVGRGTDGDRPSWAYVRRALERSGVRRPRRTPSAAPMGMGLHGGDASSLDHRCVRL